MRIELLTQPPSPGTFAERRFAAAPEAWAWVSEFQARGLPLPSQPDACVLFDDEKGHTWVGIFGSCPLLPFSVAVPFSDDLGRTALVVSGGQGYVVDGVTGNLIRRTPWYDARAAIPVPGKGFAIVTNDLSLWAAGRTDDRYAWRADTPYYSRNVSTPLPRVALDGIVFDSITATELSGKAWEGDGWYAFRLRFLDFEFVLGAYLTSKWDTFGLSASAGEQGS